MCIFSTKFGYSTVPTKLIDIICFSILIIYVILFITFHTRFEWFNDDASYYVGTAQSIIERHSLDFNFTPQTKFPPGYPLFLSMINLFFNKGHIDNELFVISTAITSLIGIAALYIIIRKKSQIMAFCISLLFLTSPFFFSHALKSVASDLPYFSATIFTFLSSLYLESEQSKWKLLLWKVIFILSLALALQLRSIGITLLVAYVVYVFIPLAYADKELWLKRIKLYTFPLFVCFISEVTWLVWSSKNRMVYYPDQYMDSYFAQIRLINPHRPDTGLASITDLIVRLFNNISIQVTHLSEMLLHHSWFKPFFMSPLVVIPLVLLSISIFYKFYKNKIDIYTLYLIFYISMLLIWPFDEGQRFILPIFCFYCWNFFDGVNIFIKKGKKHFRKIILFFFTLSFTGATSSILCIHYRNFNGLQHYAFFLFWIVNCILFLLIKIFNNKTPAFIKFWLRKMSSNKHIRCNFFNISIILWGIIVFYGIAQEIVIIKNLRKINQEETSLNYYVQAATWLKKNVPEGSVIAATQIAVPHIISGLNTIPFPVTNSYTTLLKPILKYDVDYLIITNEGKYPYFYPTDEERLKILQDSESISLSLVHSGKNFWIYRLKTT